MEILTIFIAMLALILFVLFSINKKLAILIESQSRTPVEDENIIDIKEEVTEIKSILEDIKYTTDIYEKYRLPTPKERESIDQYRIDQEIDEMLSRNRE